MKIDNIFFLIGRIKECYTDFLEKELQARGVKNIVNSHADIIVALKINGELTMSEISEKINRDRSTVTALVSKLKKLGYVKLRKNESDYRSSFSSLTEKAEKLIPDFLTISDKLYKKAMVGISEKEWERCRRVLGKIYKNFL
jgi:DNA-binding MarR family transcriptional regulator